MRLGGRSLAESLAVDPGLRSEGLLVAAVSLPDADYVEHRQVEDFYAALEERLSGIPGVFGVGSVSALPLGGSMNRWDFWMEDRERPTGGSRAWNLFVAAARPG